MFSALVAYLIFGGSESLRDAIFSRGWPPWASVIAFLATLFGIFAALELPFGYVSGFRWEREVGLSNQTFVGWLKDVGKSLGLALGTSVTAGGVLVWLLGSFPSTWWIIAWALGLVVSAVFAFLAPVLLVPLFYRLRPLADPDLRARFEALAARARIPILGIFEIQASAKTRRSNAAVMGFGRTRRIVVTDTLLRDFAPDEVEAVLAHELAHQRFLDPLRGFALGAVSSLVALAVGAWLYAATYPAYGIRSPADVAGLPLLAVLLSLASLPLRPLELAWSRRREARADRFSLELTGKPQVFASAMVRLHDLDLGVAHPRSWEKWLFYSHPPGRERIEAARAFAAVTA